MTRVLERPAALDAAAAWAELASPVRDAPVDRFDPSTLDGLPGPVARWLARAVPAGAPLHRAAVVSMRGRIRLGPKWFPFTADQVLRAGVGFVWRPVVGGRVVRFEGVDVLSSSESRMEFRFHGRVPVVRGSGPDLERSAAGRLAGETVLWLPQALTPAVVGADAWRRIDDHRSAVAVPTPSGPIEVEVTFTEDDRIASVGFRRWQDTADPPAEAPFGGPVEAEFLGGDGVAVCGRGAGGWQWGTPQWSDGEFFRYEVTDLDPVP